MDSIIRPTSPKSLNSRIFLLFVATTVGCVEPAEDNPTGQDSADRTETEGHTSAPDPEDDPTDPIEPEDDEDDTDEDPGTVFLDRDGPPPSDCDVWTQDCPAGEKCMPYANDGGPAWNAASCFAMDPDPAQPGDDCVVQGTGVSGVDNCDVASMCWNVDAETGIGTCVSFCTGSTENNACDDPSTSCGIYNEGVLILCLPRCDPLVQDCATGQGCYASSSANGFVCAPSVGGGQFGDPCEFLNACEPGLACAPATGVPNCTGSLGCCSSFCDISDPTAGCPGAGGGQECVGAFEEGNAPPGYTDVGVCLIPQ